MYEVTLPSIIIPIQSPDGRLPALVDAIRSQWDYPIIVVNDGSGPENVRIFRALQRTGCTVLTHRVKKGVGEAIKTGVHHAKNHYPISIGYIVVASPLSCTPEAILQVADALESLPNTLVFEGFAKKGSGITHHLLRWWHQLSTGYAWPERGIDILGVPAICGDTLLAQPCRPTGPSHRFYRHLSREGFPCVVLS
ncbi:glycosyltransferase family 2 protein [Eubacterium sp.]|uniref:glycosyltransferase family 2 protein n=1 Tax=Eubacterium sp. TaxID=142586 RepID=UPI002FCB48F2